VAGLFIGGLPKLRAASYPNLVTNGVPVFRTLVEAILFNKFEGKGAGVLIRAGATRVDRLSPESH
jgi:hypothetical protein